MLQGNNLKEWIAALEPISLEQFKTLEPGTKIIHLESSTMQPDTFERLELKGVDIDPESEEPLLTSLVWFIPAGDSDGVFGAYPAEDWFLYPKEAFEEKKFPAALTKGKVKEIGNGNWKSI